jgi:glucose/arabinose dehydrogenase
VVRDHVLPVRSGELALTRSRPRLAALVTLGASLALLVSAAPVSAAASLVPIATGLDNPLFVTNAGDGSGRLFIVEQGGKILVYKSGAVLPTPFLDIGDQLATGTEQGFLGLAFHPHYETNGKFYVYFTRRGGDIAINEYHVTSNPDVATRAGGRRIITIAHPPSTNHNGGMLAFGKDGYLYIGVGDGGGSGDAGNHAQNKDSLLGKILRININGTLGSRQYLISKSNPFVGKPGRNEIWSYGLRNPWRFSFDRLTGNIWVGDVGQDRYEEIDRKLANSTAAPNGRGSNYGWRVLEGSHCFRPSSGCSKAGKVLPITEYSHAGGRCSVTGGYVYRGTASPSLAGRYVFADFCSGTIWTVSASAPTGTTRTVLLASGLMVSSFGEDEAGEVYVVDHGGAVYQLVAS